MRIARRLQWVAILSLVIIVASGAVAIAALVNVEKQQRAIVDQELPASFALGSLNQGAREVISSANEFALLSQLGGSQEALAVERASTQHGMETMNESARKYATSLNRSQDQEIVTLAAVQATSHDIASESLRFMAVADDPTATPADVLLARQAFERAENAFTTVVDIASSKEDNDVSATAASATHASTLGIAAVAIATMGLVTLTLLLSWTLWRATVPPLRELAVFSGRVGKGDLDARTGLARDDEIGELAHAMDTMANDLARSTHEVEATRSQVARSERLASLGTLVAGVAHEINNPLSYIRGNIELMQLGSADILSGAPQSARQVEELLAQSQTALKGIDRIASITKSLKVIARSSSKVRAGEDINVIAASVVTIASPRFGETVLVNSDLRATRKVLANGSQLAQILINLLFNAADATREKGSVVKIRSFDEADLVVLEVEDDGPGIPLDTQARIFTPFYTTKEEGTGLGLSLSHSIAVDHGGALTFRSSPTSGTTFRLEMPALRKEIFAQ